MRNLIVSSVDLLDEWGSKSYLKLFNEKSSLLAFLFHGIFQSEDEIKSDVAYPQQEITIDHFRQFLDYYLEREYIFVTPFDIINGLNPGENYVLATFDDGYFNNQFVLPLLKEYEVPATFFISTTFVEENKSFWWDAIYRERIKRGASKQKIKYELETYKNKTNEAIERFIVKEFGKQALTPVGDIDRPFTPSELSNFSKEPFVHLGNHTSNHAILTNYSAKGIKTEIESAQESIYKITGEGECPIAIAYPNGNVTQGIVKICKDIGLKLGFTISPQKNKLPFELAGDRPFRINRFSLRGRKLTTQLELSRSDVQLRTELIKIIKGLSK